jgi:hypothetical protein
MQLRKKCAGNSNAEPNVVEEMIEKVFDSFTD